MFSVLRHVISTVLHFKVKNNGLFYGSGKLFKAVPRVGEDFVFRFSVGLIKQTSNFSLTISMPSAAIGNFIRLSSFFVVNNGLHAGSSL